VAAYDPKIGKSLWTFKGLPTQVFASPAVGEGVLVAMGHNSPSGTKVIAMKLGGTGDVSETNQLWEVNLKKECVGSGVVAEGCVFLVTTKGFALCLDLKTGKQMWQERLPGHGGSWSSLVLVNGRLLVAELSGQVSVLAASPKFKLVDTNVIPDETTCSSPAIANGHVFLRTHVALWCFGNTP
jgi:outer membrane protein assembly factor BamB